MDNKASMVVIHASAFFGPIIVPVLFMLVTKDREVKNMAIQALLFHLLLSLLLFVSFILTFILIGLPLLIFFGIIGIWYPIKGIISAAQEVPFGYPIVAKWLP